MIYFWKLKPSDEYKQRIINSFDSEFLAHNLLELIREFGFLHFCSSTIFEFDEYFDHFIERNYWRQRRSDYWWRGFSPYDIDYSKTFKNLFYVLVAFEKDERFSEHLSCFSEIFNVPIEVIKQEYLELKDGRKFVL